MCRQEEQASDILKLTTVTECQGTTITVCIQQSCMPDQFDGSPSRNGDRYEGLVNLLWENWMSSSLLSITSPSPLLVPCVSKHSELLCLPAGLLAGLPAGLLACIHHGMEEDRLRYLVVLSKGSVMCSNSECF